MRHMMISLLAVVLMATALEAQERKRQRRGYPPSFPEAEVLVYKTIGDVKLNLYLFTPEGHKASDKRPAIVFFFGGGWRGGSPAQFHEQCKYLASRGMVAAAADYRVSSRHQVQVVDCVADAKSAVRFVRANAKRLGVDPDRIAAGGGSAGGHLAACTGTVTGFDEPAEAASVSSVPNAMVLFNPALVLAAVEGQEGIRGERLADLHERMGTDPANLSPYHQVKKGAPPAIIFHGTADTVVPFRTAELFTEAMTAAGNRAKLVPTEGAKHGFFNHGRQGNAAYRQTVRAMDRFLADLGYLEGEPTIAAEPANP